MAHAREKVSMSMGGKKIDATAGRKEMSKIIEGFRKEGEKRRSQVLAHPNTGSVTILIVRQEKRKSVQQVKEPSEGRLISFSNGL